MLCEDGLELLITSAYMCVAPRASCGVGRHYQLSYSPSQIIQSLSGLMRTEREHGYCSLSFLKLGVR